MKTQKTHNRFHINKHYFTMKIIVYVLIFSLTLNKLHAQVEATVQLNNFYSFPAYTEDRSYKSVFTGISAEIGVGGDIGTFYLQSGLYIPKNYEFSSYREDMYFGQYAVDLSQRIFIYELGFYGKYFPFYQSGNVFRIYTNSGLEVGWSYNKEQYEDFSGVEIIESYVIRNMRVALGFGFEIELKNEMFLVNDFLLKYPFTDNYFGYSPIDVTNNVSLAYNVGLKVYLFD